MSLFSEKDLAQLAEKGISKEKVRNQLETFRDGIAFINLKKAAVIGDGILKFSRDEEEKLISKFEKSKLGLTLLKFIPASGAASRMFKSLFNFLETYDPSKEKFNDYLERSDDSAMREFSERLEDFPFYTFVKDKIGRVANTEGEAVHLFAKELLSEKGLNYGFYPKGLLPFHKYQNQSATPFEEHLKEGAAYAKTRKESKLHFTISEHHTELFEKEFESIKPWISEKTETIFDVTYSYQKSSTDTVAVDLENALFRNNDGSLLFRPAGHGALIENLNEQDADIIFIKNIDNVVVKRNVAAVANSKMVLAGLLLEVQATAFLYAKLLGEHKVSEKQLEDIKLFLEEKLNVRFSESYDSYQFHERAQVLKDKINRPIRICGMVKNEGEPGGGPFWINDHKDRISLQIIESAQIDTANQEQKAILSGATHFNPVDLVCGVRNYKGEKYNLLNFINSKQGFITEKTKDGKELKALELPGLWNGAMAYWNTIFVEVPLVTFNPVKTVNDLLKTSHQVV